MTGDVANPEMQPEAQRARGWILNIIGLELKNHGIKMDVYPKKLRKTKANRN